MKKLSFLLLMSSLFYMNFANSSSTEVGISVIGAKSDANGEYTVDGVVFMDYEGYDYSINSNKSLYLAPTSIDVSVNGKKVQVYSDAATMHLYPREDMQVAISAISIDYRKFNDFTIRQDGKASLLDTSITKFIPMGSIDLDLSAGLALGGYTKHEFEIDDVRADFRDTHFYSIDAGVGAFVPVAEDFDLYIYGGATHQKGKDSEVNSYGIEVELQQIPINDKISFSSSLSIKRQEYVTEGINMGDLFNDPEDTMILFTIEFAIK